MKTLFLRACALLLTLAVSASAEIIGVENFDYADGAIAGKTGGTFWDYKNVAPAGHTGTASNWDNFSGAPAVTSGRLVTNNNSAKREYNGANETQGAVNDANVQKSVYYRVTFTTGATLPDFAVLSSYDFGTERVALGKAFGQANFSLVIIGQNPVSSAIAIQPNTTYTLVAKVDYAGNTVSLFVDPNFAGAEPAPQVSAAFPNAEPSTALRIASGFAGSAVTWDNLIVATSWDDFKTVVTTTADEDNGSLGGGTGVSLREAVKYSFAGVITFAPALSGKTITLTAGELALLPGRTLSIDAASLPLGITIDGNDASRLFSLTSGRSLTLRALTLSGGNSMAAADSTLGGAISNVGGSLRLFDCTLTGNRASQGGAIYSDTDLAGVATTLTRCTLAGNRANSGGALSNNDGLTRLIACTISENNAGNGGGVSSFADAFTETVLDHTLVSANTGGDVALISTGNNSFTSLGRNLIGVGSGAGDFNQTGDQTGVTNPRLSPLGYFGGPTQTLHPLLGSPAIDMGDPATPSGTDQRGFPAIVDGNSDSFLARDIGAVECGPLVTVTAAGDGSGATLRAAITLAGGFGTPGARIRFDSAIFPATITLASGEIVAPATSRLFIDASNLPGPVTISGNNLSRAFNIAAGASLAMHSLVVQNGRSASEADGGGILNAGSLSLISCAVLNNRTATGATGSMGNFGAPGGGDGGGGGFGGNSGRGGGIFSIGPLSLAFCTLAGNATGDGGRGGQGGTGGDGPTGGDGGDGGNGGKSGDGGGLYSRGALTVATSTVSGNVVGNAGREGIGGFPGFGESGLGSLGDFGSKGFEGAAGSGGGIYKEDNIPYRLTACTIAGNGAANDGGSVIFVFGGGVANGAAILQHCVIADNTVRGMPQDVHVNSVTYRAANLLGFPAVGAATGPAPIIANPLLAPLANYGGPTPTMALQPGSPARNAAPSVEVQQINIGSLPITFALTFQGQTTATLNQNSTAGQVESELGFVSTIGAGNVSVLRTTNSGGSILFVITFTGTLAGGDQPQITASNGAAASTLTDYVPPRTRDQRGFPTVGAPDLGAYEAGTITNFTNFIWETLPASATAAQHAATFDFDGDGATNEGEYLAGTVVTNPLSVFRVKSASFANGQFSLSFPSVAGRTYRLETSPDLINWTLLSFPYFGTGGDLTIIITPPNIPRYFIRPRVGF